MLEANRKSKASFQKELQRNFNCVIQYYKMAITKVDFLFVQLKSSTHKAVQYMFFSGTGKGSQIYCKTFTFSVNID